MLGNFNLRRLDRAFAVVREAVERSSISVAAVAVANDHEVIRSEIYGAGSPDSIFYLASISKPLTGLACMRLVQDGKIQLDRSIADYLPEFVQSGKPDVNVWHLMTHTSGVEEIDWSRTLQEYPNRTVGFDIACKMPITFTPGSKFRYSSLTFYLLAEIVARTCGMTYPDYMQREIFQPLGMRDTTLDPRHHPSRMIPVENVNLGIEKVSAEQATNHLIEMQHPGAGWWSSAHDLMVLGQALLRDVKQRNSEILSPTSIDLMTREHTTSIHDMAGQPVCYGLTWRKGCSDPMISLSVSNQVFEHDGAAGGQFWIDPANNFAFIYLASRFGADSSVRQHALQTIYSAMR